MAPDEAARAACRPWAAATWLFLIEPVGTDRCRLISRYRMACSDDLGSMMALGPALVEPIGGAMDRRMLLGIKTRAEGDETVTVGHALSDEGVRGREAHRLR